MSAVRFLTHLGAAMALLLISKAATSEITAVVGDGRLLAGFNAQGHLAELTWPGPGTHGHLGASPAAMPRPGAWWALETNVGIRVVEQPRATQRYVEAHAPILETVHRIEGTEIVCLQTVFSVPGRDLLVWRIEVLGAGAAMRAALFCAASPALRPLPPLPLPAAAYDGMNDFARFIDHDETVAFALRPGTPGRRAWQRARAFAAEGARPDAWRIFNEGAWLAAAPGTEGGAVGLVPLEAARRPEILFSPPPRPAMTGPGAVVVLPRVHTRQGRAEATVIIALGRGHEDTSSALAEGRALGFHALYEETRTAWEDRLAMRPLAGAQAALSPWIIERALLTLHLATHPGTGAIAHALMPQKAATVRPRDAGWLALACALAGQPAMGAAHLRFLARHVREAEQPGAPAGSIPAQLYTSGTPATPDALIDLDAAGWWLSACQRYGQTVSRREELALYRDIWPAVARAGEFLAVWTDPITDALMPSWQPTRMRDGTSVDSMLAGFMGLLAAEHIAITLGEDPYPEWRPRRRALEAALQFRFIQHGAPWPMEPALRYWLDGVTPPGHWMRRPMRVGAGAWTPLDTVALPAVRETFVPTTRPLYFTNTREAALQLVTAYHD